MLTRMMKRVSIGALLLVVIFWDYAPTYGLPLRFVVSLSALMVAIQAVRAKKFYWALGFYVLSGLFNPFVTVLTLKDTLSVFVVLTAVASFALSLATLKTQPLLSIPSITGRTPPRESL